MITTLFATLFFFILFSVGFESAALGGVTGFYAVYSDYFLSFAAKKHAGLMLMMKMLGIFSKILVVLIAFIIASSLDVISPDKSTNHMFVLSIILVGFTTYLLVTKKISESL